MKIVKVYKVGKKHNPPKKNKKKAQEVDNG